MISAILIYNQKGEVLISRLYRDGLRRSIADVFRIQVISNPETASPVLTIGSTSFLHIKHDNVYVVAVTRGNADATIVFEFLYELVRLCKAFFNRFDEMSIKNNFSLIYELLDEVLDFGFPQHTDLETLKAMMSTEGVKVASSSSSPSSSLTQRKNSQLSQVTQQATGAVSWRRPDIKYRRNEVFLDVFEDIDLLMSASGAVLKADVQGRIVVKSQLSGWPECRFGLNDSLMMSSGLSKGSHMVMPESEDMENGPRGTGSVTLEDCQFHQCVQLDSFDADKTITFIPPDGEFELMRYRAVENVSLPFKVVPTVTEIGRHQVDFAVSIIANFSTKLHATDVVVRVPTPKNTTKVTTQSSSSGKARYDPAHDQIEWKIGRFSGGSEYTLRASAELASTTNEDGTKFWARPPISLDFSLSMYTSSGIMVRYLRITDKSNYKTVKWVRYVVRAGSYEVRF